MAEKSFLDYRDLDPDPTFDHGTKFGVSDVVGAENSRFSIIRFEPGERGPLSYHQDPVEEYYFVVEGTFDIELDGDRYVAEPGCLAYIPPGTPHRPENNTDAPAVLLVVQSPPSRNTTYLGD